MPDDISGACVRGVLVGLPVVGVPLSFGVAVGKGVGAFVGIGVG